MAAHRLGQVEAYLTVRRVLSEASTASDGVLSRERSDFYRFGYGTLGYYSNIVDYCCSRDDLINFTKQKTLGFQVSRLRFVELRRGKQVLVMLELKAGT